MARDWDVTQACTIDIGDEGEVVRELSVALVGGSVDVVAHDEDYAVLEVHEVEGEPLRVRWDGRALRLEQTQEPRTGLLGWIAGRPGRSEVRLTVALPRGASVGVQTVSADLLVDGLHADVQRESVSGSTTLRGVRGDLRVESVSGVITAEDVEGEMHVSTVSAGITLSRVTSRVIDLNSVSGALVADITRVDERCLVDIDSVSGSAHLRVPDVPVEVSCDSLGGSVTVDGVARPRTSRSFSEQGALVRVTLDGVSSSLVLVRADLP